MSNQPDGPAGTALAPLLEQHVESVAVEKAWYCTLPSGTIRVRVVMF